MKVDPRVLIKRAEPRDEVEYQAKHSFADFGLNAQITANIARKDYLSPTPIQDQIIGPVLMGQDAVGIAATGTGKTAAYLLPIIQGLADSQEAKAIIIVPTRELALQIATEGKDFAEGIRCHFTLVIGGVSIKRQINELRRNPQVVVGTPGRIKDLMERGELKMGNYRRIVLDEVDRMLDMGFVRDITEIIGKLPSERNSLFFSATMNQAAEQVANSFLSNPVKVRIEEQSPSANINQDIVRLEGKNKIDVLHDLLIQPGFDRVLVFGRTKRGMEKLSQVLTKRGFSTASIHGNKSQSQRQKALRAFKQSEIKVLLATDVAARGIDVENVTHVINYELPETYADYIHRIGRTGRAEKTGQALTFVE